VQESFYFLLAGTGVLFIGLSKAGFGGGLGMLTTPLCVMAFGPRDAIGILLPLLSAGDLFSLYHYWGKWERNNLKYLLPGVVIGVLIGVQLIEKFSARQLNVTIGVMAVAFVLFQFVKKFVFRVEGKFSPNYWSGTPFGMGAGFTSAVAHGAGPVMYVFLIPQKLAKEIFVGTNVLVFTWINWIKMPFFISQDIINRETVEQSLFYLPLVPLGVWLGVWLNRKVSEDLFSKLTYALTFAAGVYLILGRR
jgi:uncharacterized protein